MKRHLLRLWSGLVPMLFGVVFGLLAVGVIYIVIFANKLVGITVIVTCVLVFAYLTGDCDDEDTP